MSFYRRLYEQLNQIQQPDPALAREHQFAGANARIPPGVRTVLDVGCGNGGFLHGLPDSYWKVGLDVSDASLRRLADRGVQGSIEALPFTGGAFDLVTCFEVLEHLPQDVYARAVPELERLSRKYIIVSVPNKEVLAESLVRCPLCSCAFHPSGHLRSFDEAALGKLFRRSRMTEVRAVGPIARYGVPGIAALAVHLARRTPPPVAVCPQCGFSSRAHATGRLVNSGATARKLAQRVLFRRARPYWLLALYERTP
jgi:SAM-dependent methyltransferase